MKPLYVRVVLFDPLSDEEFPVSDGIQVDVVKINDFNPLVGFDRRSLKYNVENKDTNPFFPFLRGLSIMEFTLH